MIGQWLNSFVFLVLIDRVEENESSSFFEVSSCKIYQSLENDKSVSALDFGPIEFFPVFDSLPVESVSDRFFELFFILRK